MNVVVAGAAQSHFGMFVDTRLRDLAARAVDTALADAGAQPRDVGLVVVGNAAAGLLTGQEMIRAQTILSSSQLAGVPALAVENACASSSSAFHVGCMAIESGMYDVVVVVGAEKMTHEDRSRAGRALATAMDVEARQRAEGAGEARGQQRPRPVFMEVYAAEARAYMERSGATARDFAAVAAKSTRRGSANPVAQVRRPLGVDDVLASRTIVEPLTRPMCSSIGDGAAAVVLSSIRTARRRGFSGPRVVASVVESGSPEDDGRVVERAIARAYATAGVGPRDLDVAEVHDAAAPAELVVGEQLGIVDPGDGPRLVRDGIGDLGGTCPLNPSGGLLARGHPIGATGVAQLVELTDQLRGRAGERQVDGARVALAENAGGSLGPGPAACCVTILERHTTVATG